MAEPNQYINRDLDSTEIPSQLPLLLLRDAVLFPNVIFPLMISDKKTIKMVNHALEGDRIIGAFTANPKDDKNTLSEEPYNIGTAASIAKMFRMPDDSVRLLVQGLSRIKLENVIQEEPFKIVRISLVESVRRKSDRLEALSRLVVDEFRQVIDSAPYLSEDMKAALINIDDAEVLADLIAANLNVNLKEKQTILETINVKQRLEKVSALVSKELKLLKLRDKIKEEVDEEIEKNRRQYYLREQLKAIKKELGEENEQDVEINELRKRLEETPMPEKTREVAEKQLNRLTSMNPASAEYPVVHNYLEWILDLPWEKSTEDNINLSVAREILDEDHYGLDDVKDRILEYLAVRKLRESTKGSILCFSGPPGVGKTSLGRSIARAMGREFVRIALGGMRDEAEIRGHRRTYIGALPGRIIQSLKTAGSNNPVFMLDEIDKVGADFRGDPESALLEVLDPEQNNSFTDHYLDMPFDLSKVMFITTANVIHTISPPLRDRMEIIQLPGYITLEKTEIARRYLVPRQIAAHGLDRKHLRFTKGALARIIQHYTRESGVRNLERVIARVCRKVAFRVASGESAVHKITVKNFIEYLGEPKFIGEITDHPPMVGVATGLAYTPVGGEVLLIEATKLPGTKSYKLTGQLGDVMRESAEIALSYLRANSKKFKIKQEFYKNNAVHIHVPSGATPKDGPSAGITMTTALASLLTGRKVRNDVAMTGEITLRGVVLPIGGLREKVVAAVRAGIKEIIVPSMNRKDLKDIPEDIREKVKQFHFVDKIDEVLKIALMPESGQPKTEKKSA